MKSIQLVTGIVASLLLFQYACAQELGAASNVDHLLDAKIQDAPTLHNALAPANAIAFILATNHIPGGIIEAENCNGQDSVLGQKRVFNLEGWTVREALDFILSAAPGYTWTIKDNVVDILPRPGLPDLLTLNIGNFETGANSGNVDIEEKLFNVATVKQYLSSHGLAKDDPLRIIIGTDNVHIGHPISIKNATPVQVLNAEALAYGGNAVWRYTERTGHCKQTYDLDWPAL